MAEMRPASPDQAELLAELLEHRLLIATGVPGVYGRGGDFEDVRERVAALGAVGDYVARTYEETKNRPLYVVTELLNLAAPLNPQDAFKRAVILEEPYVPHCHPTVLTTPAFTTSVGAEKALANSSIVETIA